MVSLGVGAEVEGMNKCTGVEGSDSQGRIPGITQMPFLER